MALDQAIATLAAPVITLVAGVVAGRVSAIRRRSQSAIPIDSASGVIGVYPKLPMEELSDEISQARHVEILQTCADNLIQLQPAFQQAANANAKIRILLISPDSIMLKYRAHEYRDGSVSFETLRNRLIDQIQDMKAFCRQNNITNNVLIRLYDGTPVLSIYQTDKIVYLGNFWRRGSAMQCPQLKAKDTGYYPDWATKHFDAIWDDKNTKSA